MEHNDTAQSVIARDAAAAMAAADGALPVRPKIGAEELRRANGILKKYKEGKTRLEQRIIDNEQFWKLRHWEQMEKEGQGGNSGDPQPASGWLVMVRFGKVILLALNTRCTQPMRLIMAVR